MKEKNLDERYLSEVAEVSSKVLRPERIVD